MIADKPDWNVDASPPGGPRHLPTNSVKVDFDFFTAVDDFKAGRHGGSDMGRVRFNRRASTGTRCSTSREGQPRRRRCTEAARSTPSSAVLHRHPHRQAELHGRPQPATPTRSRWCAQGLPVPLANASQAGAAALTRTSTRRRLHRQASRAAARPPAGLAVGDAAPHLGRPRDLPAGEGAPACVERLAEFYATVARLCGRRRRPIVSV